MLANIKITLIIVAISITVFGSLYLYVALLKDDIKTLELDLNLANSAVAVKNSEIQFAEEAAEKSKGRAKTLSAELVRSNEAVADMRTLFNDHDFQKLVEAKPAMITKRMIKATERVFQELEDASR